MTPQRIVLGAWITAIGLAAVRSLTDPQSPSLPVPSVFLGSGVLFTLLYGASNFVGPVAAAVAVGLDIGIVARPYLAGSSSSPVSQLAAFLGHLDGSSSPSSAPGGGSGAFVP